jgi:hypothetical protein
MYSGALRSVRKLDKTIQIAAAQAKQGARYDGSKSLFQFAESTGHVLSRHGPFPPGG